MTTEPTHAARKPEAGDHIRICKLIRSETAEKPGVWREIAGAKVKTDNISTTAQAETILQIEIDPESEHWKPGGELFMDEPLDLFWHVSDVNQGEYGWAWGQIEGEIRGETPAGYNANEQLKSDHQAMKSENASKDPIEGKAIQSEIQIPTPGRIVHLLSVMRSGEYILSRPAGVVQHVDNPGTSSDTLIQVDDWMQDDPDIETRDCIVRHISECCTGEIGWDWMPFQKGQAALLDETKAAALRGPAGMLGKPTDEELGNRFSYHAPKAGQPELYREIRAQALEFAYTISDRCPPSAELARALDHLDQAVFSANAAIARHG